MLCLLGGVAQAADRPAMELWRLDCGKFQVNVLDTFSDVDAYGPGRKALVGSCYLIRHGEVYMLWDTGLPVDVLNKPFTGKDDIEASLTVTLVDQLKQLDLKPEQISIVGLSHDHYDHTGQAAAFPGATLMIGRADAEHMRATPNGRGGAMTHWITGDGKWDKVDGDRDVFADGSVIMINLPGHTPGHHGLLVKLPVSGYVLLSGDVAHFAENLATNGVPGFNADRAQSLASMERFKALGANHKAKVIIQHEPGDVKKLPPFPQSAK
jgi:glyoxylase-like metal-dependent hydrolase (beta-lactamase superfamily II)